MKMIKRSSLMSWAALRRCQELDSSDYVEWSAGEKQEQSQKLICISHRWIASDHPDPEGEQLRELQQRLDTLITQDQTLENALIFYDYCSMYQRPRTANEEAIFRQDIESLNTLFISANKVMVLSEGYSDYKYRSWCFLEAVVSSKLIHYFEDQARIKDDLDFLGNLLSEDIKQFTSYDMEYKSNPREAELIVAAFQHLASCKATHADDLSLIKQLMVEHFNNRRLTPFGKLVTALNKYFDVSFILLPAGGKSDAIACKPYFDAPDWSRLPPLEPDVLEFIARMEPQPSLFAHPPFPAQGFWRKQPRGYYPGLRLTMPGIDNYQRFLRTFQDAADWQEYIVDPMPLGVGDVKDAFPSIDYVMHTVLERPPGFFTGKKSECLYVFLKD